MPVWFHEDDYCQVEVLPAAAHGYCVAEMGRIEECGGVGAEVEENTAQEVRGRPPGAVTGSAPSSAAWSSWR